MAIKIEKVFYQVDEAMLGSGWNEDGKDDLEKFCDILQKLCDELCLFVKIEPITSSMNGAINNGEVYDNNGNLVSIEWLINSIPWNEAIDKYFEDKQF